MKNPHKNDLNRQAFNQALQLFNDNPDLEYMEVSKQLDHSLPRWLRQQIAAKVARLFKQKRNNE